jgi:hypothetical protein
MARGPVASVGQDMTGFVVGSIAGVAIIVLVALVPRGFGD